VARVIFQDKKMIEQISQEKKKQEKHRCSSPSESRDNFDRKDCITGDTEENRVSLLPLSFFSQSRCEEKRVSLL
jgi:hypothetical protein